MKIAIISAACRFPDAGNIQQFWKNMEEGKCSLNDIPDSRWKSWKNSFPDLSAIEGMNRKGGFLANIDQFDPGFFKLNEEESFVMDPQQRLGLELAYETLYSSTKTNHKNSKIGVFVGITYTGYADLMRKQIFSGEIGSGTVTAGNLPNFIATRICNRLDLQGPSMVIDTACSSSLAAIKIAIDNINLGQCEMALAGGVFLKTSPSVNVAMFKAGAISKHAQYRIFDEQSDGILLGEGGGFILLKPYEKAVADGDNILGIIRNVSLNNDGKSISALAPRALTQQTLLENCYQEVDICPSKINYLEAHGTGTALGDATEARSTSKIFDKNSSLYMGSVKANIGHLMSVSGIASVIKSLGILVSRKIPPFIGLEERRKNLPIQENIKFNKETIEITGEDSIKIGINGFGFGGTNAHVILEEYPNNKENQRSFKQISPPYQKRSFWFRELEEQTSKIQVIPTIDSPIKAYKKTWKIFDLSEPKVEDRNTTINIFHHSDQQELANKIECQLRANSVIFKEYSELREPTNISGDLLFLFPEDYKSLYNHLSLLNKIDSQAINRLLIVTQNAVFFKDSNSKYEEKDFLKTGVCFAALSAFPQIKISQLDISNSEDIVPAIKPLLQSEKSPYLILNRNNKYWIPDFKLEDFQTVRKYPYRKKGIYLITGGASGLGAQVASSLVKEIKEVQLILTGRRLQKEVPNLDELIKILSSTKATIDYIPCDVSDEIEIEHLFNQIQSKYGKLDGIIHAAGVQHIQAWDKTNQKHFEETLASKQKGTVLIKQQLLAKNWQPDFVVAFSSIASCLPNLGKGISAYIVANSFLDQYIPFLQEDKTNWKVINWGLWKQTGMSKNDVAEEQLSNYGLPPLNANEASQLLHQILNIDHSEIAVFDHSVPLSQLFEVKHAKPKIAPIKSQNGSKKPAIITKFIVDTIAKELDLASEDINLNENLLDLGLDSLMAMELAIQLESFGYDELPFEFFYDYQTIADIVGALERMSTQEVLTEAETSSTSEPTLLPLSNNQKAFVKAQTVSEAPNISFLRISIQKGLEVQTLKDSIYSLLKRHPILRTNFQYELENEALRFWQQIKPIELSDTIELEVKVLEGKTIREVEDEFVNRPFDLKTDFLIRFGILEVDGLQHIFICGHHSVVDGWSLKIIAQDLFQIYKDLREQKDVQIPECSAFLDWIPMQEEISKNPSYQNWWKNKVPDFPKYANTSSIHKDFKLHMPALNLPGSCYSFSIPELLAEELENIAKQERIPLSVLYKTHYANSISKWLNQSEILLSIADLNRNHKVKNIRSSVGCFAETYPLAISCREDSLVELAKQMQTKWEEVKTHSPYDSSKIMQFVKDAGRDSLVFGFSFNYFNSDWTDQFSDISFQESNARGFTNQTRFSIQLWKDGAIVKGSINYPKGLLSQKQLDRFKSIFISLPKKEKFISAPTSFKPIKKNIQNDVIWQIRNHAKFRPNDLALKTENELINYGELEKRVANLAGALASKGVVKGMVVGFVGSHSEKAIISLLAVWRLGGVWLALDENLPIARMDYMLSTAKASFLILENEPIFDCSIPQYTFSELIAAGCGANFICPISSDQTIYILYTSGTSGQPKAIPITYPGFANNLSWYTQQFDVNARDIFIFSGSISFDATIRQMVLPLQLGASICVINKNIKGNARFLSTYIEENKITIWHSVPSLFEKILQAIEHRKIGTFEPLRLIMLGGEALPPQIIRRWQKIFQNQQIFVNLYGPTEATINTTFHIIQDLLPSDQKVIPIGRPIRNTETYIVNEEMEEASVGELLLAGPMLSAGYIDRPDLNKEKFINFKNKRCYRTGDKVSKNQLGELVYHGRIDRQIKIRGIRMEPAEIEHHLLQIPGIKKALVENQAINGSSNLVAILETDNTNLTLADLKEALSDQLPVNLIPNKLICLKEFPLLANEKVDLLQLKRLIQEKPKNNKESKKTPETFKINGQNKPLSSLEGQLAKIWERLLNVEVKGTEDSFFDLGGDSLKVMVLFLELEKAGWKNLPTIANFSKDSRLSVLANHLRQEKENNILPKTSTKTFALNPAQLGFYYSNRKSQEDFAVMKSGYYLNGYFDPNVFKSALETVCQRHLMLQVKLDGKVPPNFVVVDNPYIQFQFKDLTQLEAPLAATTFTQYLKIQQETVINIEDYPLIRMLLLRVKEDRYLWYIHAHHILADGVSSLILGQEILRVYQAYMENKPNPLMPLKYHFPDYLNYLKDQPKDDANLTFWSKQFKEKYDPPELSIIENNSADSFLMFKEELEYLRNFGKQLNSVFVCCFYRALSKLLNRTDIIIGVPAHGRPVNFPDIHKMVGSFAVAHPIRIKDRDINLEELDTHIQAALSKELPFSSLKKELSYQLPLHKLMGSQFFCTYLDATPFLPNDEMDVQIDWSASFLDYKPSDKETDLLFSIKKVDKLLILNFAFSSKFFSNEMAKQFIASLLSEWENLNKPFQFQFQSDPLKIADTGPLDSILIGYLPSVRRAKNFLPGNDGTTLKFARQFIKPFFPDNKPKWLTFQNNQLGKTGYLSLPLFAEEIHHKNSKTIIEQIENALKIAERMGAKAASLAGQLATVTGYGKEIYKLENRPKLPLLTTGHQTTVAGVAKTVIKATEACKLSFEKSSLAVIGLGSVGSAVLTSLLKNYKPPEELLLFDLPIAESRIQSLIHYIRSNLNFQGNIKLFTNPDDVQSNLYQADIIVSAISGNKMVVNIDKLKPGTIVVDDSFPHIFNESAAKERMIKNRDILILGGGLFEIKQFEKKLYFPIKNTQISKLIQQSFHPHTIAGCQLESLLLGQENISIPPTIGPVDYRQKNDFYDLLSELNIEVAPLHLGDFIISSDIIESIIKINQQKELCSDPLI